MAKKTDELNDELDSLDGAEPRVYELGFHLDPELPQEEVKKAYQDIRGRIEASGSIIAEGEPVKIPLAYTISRMDTTGRRDFSSAFFCWIAYEADGAGHDSVKAMAQEDTRIIRHLDIRTTVEEAKHSAEMQEMFAQMASVPAGEEEAADAPEAVEPAPDAGEAPKEQPAAEEAA